MSAEDRDDVEVRFTVKELLSRIETKQAEGFTRIEVSMHGKADKADVARMEARLDSHGERIGNLEQQRRAGQWAWSRLEKIGAFVVGCSLVIGAVLSTLAVLHII